MALRPLNTLALCAGIGGLELGVRRATDGLARVVCYVERDTFAASVLVARMEEARLDRAPLWDDLATFDGRPWRGIVDLVAAGFPCQPFSSAGKRLGPADERWVWPQIARIIEQVAPGLLFLENVPEIASRGGVGVASDLAALGFDAEWDCFRACDVGAPHLRERFFLLALADSMRDRLERIGESPPEAKTASRRSLAHADGGRREGERLAEHSRLAGEPRALADGRDPNGRLPWPPDRGAWLERGERWAEWRRLGAPEPALHRGAHGIPDRMDRLRVLGNGVIAEQAATAFAVLWDRIWREKR